MARTVGVSLLFTDVVGSTESAVRVGAVEAEKARQHHHRLLHRAVDAHLGIEVKSLGDGIMAVFPGVSSAIDAAIAVQRAVADENAEGRNPPVAVRAGISVGDCTEEHGDYFGEPVVTGARLCAAAEGGQILLPERAATLDLRGRHRFEPVGELRLRGLPEAVPAVSVVWEVDATESSSPVLIGRGAEVSALTAAVLDHRRSALILGEPGVGKTALTRELVRLARHQDWDVEHTACPTSGSPLGPFLHLIPSLDPFVGAGEQLAFVLAALRARTGDAPLLLVVDDAHLADSLSAALLHHVILHDVATVVMAARAGEPLPTDVATLVKDEQVDVTRLEALGREGSDALLASSLGGPIHRQLGEAIWTLAQGNPLFSRELAAASRQQGSIGVDASGEWVVLGRLNLSKTVIDVVASRLNRLDDDASRLAAALAVAEPLSVSVLEHLAPRTALAALEQSGLVAIMRAGRSSAAWFAHPIHAEAVRETVPLARLRDAMSAVADALEAGGEVDSRTVVLSARLRLDSNTADPAVLLAAARRSLEGLDLAQAVEFATAAKADGGGVEAEVILNAARWMDGKVADAVARFERLLATTTDPFQLALVVFEYARLLLQREGDATAAATVLTEQLPLLDADMQSPLRAMLALTLFFSGEPAGAAETGLSVLAGDADQLTTTVAICGAVSGLATLGRCAEARRLQLPLPGLLQELGTVLPGYVVLNASLFRLLLDLEEGHLFDASNLFEDPAGFARSPYAGTETMLHWVPGVQKAFSGLLDEAAELHERSAADAANFGLHVVSFHRLTWALVEAQRGNPAAARALLDESEGLAPDRRVGFRAWGERSRVWLLASEGAVDDAVDLSLSLAQEYAEQAVPRLLGLHDVARLGRPGPVVEELDLMASLPGATWMAHTFAAHARALVAGDPDALVEVGEHLADGGLHLEASEAFSAAIEAAEASGRSPGEVERWASRLDPRGGAAGTPWFLPAEVAVV